MRCCSNKAIEISRENDIETIDEAKRRLRDHIRRYKLEQNAKNSPDKDNIFQSDEEYQIDSLRKLQDDLISHKTPDKEPKAKPKLLKSIGKEKSMKMPNLLGIKEGDQKQRTPKRSKSEIDINKFEIKSDDDSVAEEENTHFSPNYFIHDYSSDTDDGSVLS